MVHPGVIPDSMRALVLERTGAELLVTEQPVPVPPLQPGHVLVRVEAAGFCHHDAAIMSGVLRRRVRLPLVLGHEVAGTLVAAAADVGDGWTGARVVLLPGAMGHGSDGAFAEYVLAPWRDVVPLPADLPWEQAALLACPLGVAVKAVRDVARVTAGETVVVTGVSGGLGMHAAQVAFASGATVFGVTGSPGKLEGLERQPWLAGVMLAGDVRWSDMVLALTGERGADVVIDTGGGELEECVRALAHGGRLVLMGQIERGASAVRPAEVVFREARILGSLGVERRHLDAALALVREGKVTPVVDRLLPFSVDGLLEAYRAVRAREVMGRVVLRMAG